MSLTNKSVILSTAAQRDANKDAVILSARASESKAPRVARRSHTAQSFSTMIPRLLATTLLLALTTGCTVGPKYARPNVPAPPAFRGADNADVTSDPKTSIGDQQWSAIFHEPE